jgi:TRAP-type uncharacterized transport system substrate-binding protein
MKKTLVIATILALAAGVASAQQVKVGTGGPKGTYKALFNNIAERCGTDMALVEVPSDGSLTNLERLSNKEISAAFLQTDALFASAQGRDLGNIKTLAAFNKESAHVVVLANSGLKTKGNVVGFGKQDISFRFVEDLVGYSVAAAGGSLITAQYVKQFGQVNYTVVPVASNDEAIKQLKAGTVQAAMLVGGKPFQFVRGLSSDFRLVSFKPQTIELLKTTYVKDTLNYPNLSATPVDTLATEALLVVRTVNTPERVAALADFRKCIYNNIGHWRDADGAHPAWDQVYPENKGRWAYYDLPVVKSKK